MPRVHRELGLRLIVVYKLVKAAAEALLGLFILFALTGATDTVRRFAFALRDHATAGWAISLADRLVSETTRRHMLIVAIGALLDGAFSFVEGWSLHRGYWWASWLIVCATACLLPFEVAALLRHASLPRLVMLAVNALVVAYLIRRRMA